MDLLASAIAIYETPENAYEALSAHWERTRDGFPVHGVSAAIVLLEDRLSIPKDQSVLNKPSPPPGGPDEWFR
jgi:hypothetical protein